jgi:hypothetical protein
MVQALLVKAAAVRTRGAAARCGAAGDWASCLAPPEQGVAEVVVAVVLMCAHIYVYKNLYIMHCICICMFWMLCTQQFLLEAAYGVVCRLSQVVASVLQIEGVAGVSL